MPAVEYIRAQRAHTLLIREMDGLMSKCDVFLTGTGGGWARDHEPDRTSGGRRARGFVANAPVMLMVTGRSAMRPPRYASRSRTNVRRSGT